MLLSLYVTIVLLLCLSCHIPLPLWSSCFTFSTSLRTSVIPYLSCLLPSSSPFLLQLHLGEAPLLLSSFSSAPSLSLLVPPCPSLSLLVPLYLLHHSRMISSSDPRTVKYLKRSFQVAKDAVAHGNHPFGSLLVILAEDNSGKKREEGRRGEGEKGRSGEKRRSR